MVTGRETQKKGDLAKAKAISYFTELGYEVSILITESAAYDLIVDDDIGLFKVQTKYSSRDDVDLRRIHSNAKGYVVKRYEESAFDWLFVYRPDGRIYVFKDSPASKKSISLNGAVAESGNSCGLENR